MLKWAESLTVEITGNNHIGYAVTIPPFIDEETEIQEGPLM